MKMSVGAVLAAAKVCLVPWEQQVVVSTQWQKPQFSRSQVDAAGRTLVNPEATVFEHTAALDVLNNWRASHSFPLNTLQMNLRNKARRVDGDSLIAQRLKRTSSTVEKLRRFPKMKLSRMQDIGGCRAVVHGVEQVRDLEQAFLESGFKHDLNNHKDYITEPKESGYRSIHLVYQYRSDRNDAYNNHQIEVQLRSQLQHAWATAVETVGTFLGQALKSSEGSDRWLRFFALTSSAFAAEERTPKVPNTPEGAELIGKVRREASALRVDERLGAYGMALRTIQGRQAADAHYYLLSLRPEENKLEIQAYRPGELEHATSTYLELEKRYQDSPAAQTVLVRAESIEALRRAYPNYFLDTQIFLDRLRDVIT